MMRSLLPSALVTILLLASPARSDITAWWTPIGPNVAMQDVKTGDIWYSNCNSNNTPIFPVSPPNVLPVITKPRMNTSLAIVGWYNQHATLASVYYQTENGNIINGLYTCDFRTGVYQNTGEYNISQTANAPSIHPQTGLAVELLGSSTGYRVYYHDANSSVNLLWYTNNIDWSYGGIVMPEPAYGLALASAHTTSKGSSNITVISPFDASNIGVARLWSNDGNYHLASFPRPTNKTTFTNETEASSVALDPSAPVNLTLAAWDGHTTGLDMTINKAYTRSVYYVGTDNAIHQVSNINYTWLAVPSQNSVIWPVADAGSSLGATYNFDTSEAWLYYLANGTLTQAYQKSGGVWAAAGPMPTFNATAPAPASPGNPSSTPAGDAGATGLSTGAKAGIGIGVTVGVLGLAALFGVCACLRRRRRRSDEAAAREMAAAQGPAPYSDGSYPAPGYNYGYADPSHSYAGSLGGPSPPQQGQGYVPGYGDPHQQQWEHEQKKDAVPTEMEQPHVAHELPQRHETHELA